ncbi:hypothetical protein [Crateriforma conspicua]|uniref:Uncharacterized protein n=1 Tax=Crateriforma conspicua TaxID=2527996 RepID=A0A5C5YA31_9PLAN|nr:hypothetical protein [Crateriforma conspicua]QDV64775.1 hypothetical protein Mal65_39380 [Crateriforma conspicua]TWT70172.1 hypothetical protein Pan14r_24720 [Crateriforma conspicua]
MCREDGRYNAGGLLRASWRVSRVQPDRIRCIEVSVLWHTDGKGDEDLQVHHFHRIDTAELSAIDLGSPQALDCRLPATPLSYHGRLLSIRWCLRVRLFMSGGKEIVTEQPFFVVADLSPDGPIAAPGLQKMAGNGKDVSPTGRRNLADASTETTPAEKSGEETVIFRRLKRPRTFRRFVDRS